MKIKMRIRTGILLLLLFVGFSCNAQIVNPAKWTFNTKQISPTEVELQFILKLDKSWHIYSQFTDPDGPIPLEFNFEDSKDYQRIKGVVEPKPLSEYDSIFKCIVKHFEGKVVFTQKIKCLSKTDFTIKGTLYYQLCNLGSCIAPDDVPFSFKVKGIGDIISEPDFSNSSEIDSTQILIFDTTTSTTDSVAAIASNPQQGDGAELASKIEAAKEKGSLWIVFFISFGVGLLALITPCVFPMIPMTISFFMKGGVGNKKKARQQGYIFGLSILLIFGVLGLILTLIFGKDAMYIISVHPIPNLIFFVIFMFFALSFFGLFDLTLPNWMVNKSDEKADKGGILGPFFIALTTVLVSFSCTGPILGGALISLSSAGGDRLVPLISMLGFAFGFALPFTLLAIFPSYIGKLKSGGWLNTVKVVFGFIELALGLKFLSIADLSQNWHLLDRETFLVLWIVIFGMLGFYLLGKLRFKGDEEVKVISVGRLFMSIIVFGFTFYMVPGLWGAPLKALSGYIPPLTTQDFDMDRVVYEYTKTESELPVNRKHANTLHLPTGFEGFFDLEEAKAYAKKVNKPLFVDFTGKSCANCREMENNVWSHPSVKEILNNHFVMVALYADADFIKLDEKDWVTGSNGKVLKTLGQVTRDFQISHFNMNAQPLYVLMDAEGSVLTNENKNYDKNVDNFVRFLNEGMTNYHANHK